MGNPFVHVELNTVDLDRAKDFYTKLFDWRLEESSGVEGRSYTLIKVGEGTGGGIMSQMMPGAPSQWFAYVLVDDIVASTQKAEQLGASVLKGVTEVPGMGWLSIINDPTGAVLGLWKPK